MLYNIDRAIDICKEYKKTHNNVYFNFADYKSLNFGQSTITVSGANHYRKYNSISVTNIIEFLDNVLAKYISYCYKKSNMST